MRRRIFALTLIALAGLIVACVHSAPRKRSLLPLAIFAGDGAWRGRIADGGVAITGEPSISALPAEVFVVSRSTVLLNSPANGARYISLTVEPGDCSAGGEHYAYRVSACVAPNSDRYACEQRLKGCAATDGSVGSGEPR